MSNERNVHPIAFLTSNTGEVLKQAQVSQEPVLITIDGKVEAVVQDVVSYQRTQDQLAMLHILALGQNQIEEGKVTDHHDFVAQLEAEYGDDKK